MGPSENAADYNRRVPHRRDGRFAIGPLLAPARSMIPHELASVMNSAYTLLTSEADYRQACDTVLSRAKAEIVIFDRDLAALRLEESSRLATLTDFLQRSPTSRIRMVLHDPEPLERKAPRLIRLIQRFSHVIDVRQSPESLRHLADTHLFADESDGVRRFHVDQPRSALILDDPSYLGPWRQRFEELWTLSRPCLALNTTGL